MNVISSPTNPVYGSPAEAFATGILLGGRIDPPPPPGGPPPPFCVCYSVVKLQIMLVLEVP